MSLQKPRIKWNKKKVIEEINALADSGEGLYTRNVTRVNNSLLKAARRYYGTWEKALTKAGFDYEAVKRQGREEGSKRISDGARERYLNDDYIAKQKESIKERLRTMHHENPLLTHSYLLENGNGILAMIHKYFGTIEEAMKEVGIDYGEIKKKTTRRKWSDEHIVEQLEKIIRNNEPLNVAYIIERHRQLYRSCVEYLGSWDKALALVGVDYASIKEEHRERMKSMATQYSKEYVISELHQMKKSDVPLTRKWIKARSESLYDACYNRFGSLQMAVIAAGFDYVEEMEKAKSLWLQRQREVQMKWHKEAVVYEIKLLHEEGNLLSSSFIRNMHHSLYDGAVNRFGSWGLAIEAAGFAYDEIREDSRNASYCGRLFEDMVDELFLELGVVYEKYAHEKYDPDYVFDHNVWADAKLSQWTVYSSDTIENYLKHCRYLIIVYMRGRRGEVGDRCELPNVRFISVFNYIKQLPKYRQLYYSKEIERIDDILKTFEEWKD